MECAEDGAGAQWVGSTDAGGRGAEQQDAAAGPPGSVEASCARAQRRRLKKLEKSDSARVAMAARGAAALLGPSYKMDCATLVPDGRGSRLRRPCARNRSVARV
jgi:hypothetical protein